MGEYVFREFRIRPHMVESLERYVNDGLRPGDFLTAVLANDLVGAASRADLDNARNLMAFAAYLYNNVPGAAWGSYEKVEAWIRRTRELKKATQQ
jgi:hypothetical protein